jgi:hypothetical protein
MRTMRNGGVVFYDSRLAGFGSDLGPRGNAARVNLMLPPRMRDDVDGGGGEGGVYDGDIHGNAISADDDDLYPSSSGGGDGGVGAGDGQHGGDDGEIEPIFIDAEVGGGDDDVEEEANNTTTAEDSDSGEGGGKDDAVVVAAANATATTDVGDGASGHAAAVGQENHSHAVVVVVVDAAVAGDDNDTVPTIDSTTADAQNGAKNSSGTPDVVGLGGPNATLFSPGGATESDDNATTINDAIGERNGHSKTIAGRSGDDVADYFCLEDFVSWRIGQRNSSASYPAAAPPTADPAAASTLDAVAPSGGWPRPDIDDGDDDDDDDDGTVIDGTRPLAILVRRGRCSFESKAKMAMILNDLLANSGRGNRIDHLVVYNNGTNNSDGRNEGGGEELVDMEHPSQSNDDVGTVSIDEDGDVVITVGLLYVTTSSGEDLLRRIEERGVSAGVSPYVDVSMLFWVEERPQNRAGEGHSVGGATIDDGTQGIGQDTDPGFHDEQVSHGWFFPATLTRFCLSCGPPDYGFVGDDAGENEGHEDGAPAWSLPPYPTDGFPDVGYDHFDQTNIDIQGGERPYYDDSLYYSRAWLEVIRKLMVTILVLLLVGPVLLAARRWYTVGGTVRITRDENGASRLRLVSPNLEAFVNGIPGAVETNGTKLDRAQVFSLPEIEYGHADEENGAAGGDGNRGSFGGTGAEETSSREVTDNGEGVHRDSAGMVPSTLSATQSSESFNRGRFIFSSCCSICIDEFTPGERLRILPRCDHGECTISPSASFNFLPHRFFSHCNLLRNRSVFHTECILPWLTERQGCCPVCKTPVLPDDMQRSQARSPRQGLHLVSPGGRRRRHQPQSTPATAQSSDGAELVVPTISDIPLENELESDLDSSPRLINPPGGSPSST